LEKEKVHRKHNLHGEKKAEDIDEYTFSAPLVLDYNDRAFDSCLHFDTEILNEIQGESIFLSTCIFKSMYAELKSCLNENSKERAYQMFIRH